MKDKTIEPIPHKQSQDENLEQICEETDLHAEVLGKIYCSTSFYSKVNCRFQDNYIDENRAYACLNPKYNPKVCPWKVSALDPKSTTFQKVEPGHKAYSCKVCPGISETCRSYDSMQKALEKRKNATK